MAHPPTAWIIKRKDLQNIINAGISSSVLSQFEAVANVGYGLGQTIDIGTPYIIFTSYSGLASAASSGELPGPYTGIILDLEAWPQTPTEEQTYPWYYQALGSKIAYQLGMQLIVTPGMDLISVVNGSNGAKQDPSNYLSMNFAHDAAMVGDALVIQAQRYNYSDSPYDYGTFVGQAADQARAAHPGVHVYAGLSTCHADDPATGAELETAYNNTNIYGYWLNVPGNQSMCPTGNPGAAIALLNYIYS